MLVRTLIFVLFISLFCISCGRNAIQVPSPIECTDENGDGKCDVENPEDKDVDTDGDGLLDYDETYGTYGYITDPQKADTDGDGLNDYEEVVAGDDGFYTDPTKKDTDGDGLDDKEDPEPGTVTPPADVPPPPDLVDSDNDGVADSDDNCTQVANQDQADGDQDEIGDLCDNCEVTPNKEQKDDDGDGIGEACEYESLLNNTGIIDQPFIGYLYDFQLFKINVIEELSIDGIISKIALANLDTDVRKEIFITYKDDSNDDYGIYEIIEDELDDFVTITGDEETDAEGFVSDIEIANIDSDTSDEILFSIVSENLTTIYLLDDYSSNYKLNLMNNASILDNTIIFNNYMTLSNYTISSNQPLLSYALGDKVISSFELLKDKNEFNKKNIPAFTVNTDIGGLEYLDFDGDSYDELVVYSHEENATTKMLIDVYDISKSNTTYSYNKIAAYGPLDPSVTGIIQNIFKSNINENNKEELVELSYFESEKQSKIFFYEAVQSNNNYYIYQVNSPLVISDRKIKSVKFFDFDGDGKKEIIAAGTYWNCTGYSITVFDDYNSGNALIGSYEENGDWSFSDISVGDIDNTYNDTAIDEEIVLAVTNNTNSKLIILGNNK